MRTPEQAFDLRAAMADELRAALDEFEASFGEPKGVHRCRVHVKRARALARVGKTSAPGLSTVFNDSARTVMRQLAVARDIAALAETARTLAQKRGKKQAAALARVAEQLDEERLAMAGLNMEATRAGLKDLLALAQVWPEASPRQIRRGARRIAHRARRACRRGHGAEQPDRRHE
jgi:hypothetical protein